MDVGRLDDFWENLVNFKETQDDLSRKPGRRVENYERIVKHGLNVGRLCFTMLENLDVQVLQCSKTWKSISYKT